MPDFTGLETVSSFKAASGQAAPAKTTVSIDMPTDLLQWFQGGTQPDNWQAHMIEALRFYMDTSLPAPEPSSMDEAYEAERKAAMDAMTERHRDEYETVHNGSGRSEEFPSDLDARHADEWAYFEERYPAEAKPAAPAPLKPSGMG